jgi:membrane protease YdiL (CAAX protease family)
MTLQVTETPMQTTQFDTELWVFLCLIVIANALFIGGIALGILPGWVYGYGRFLLLATMLITVVALFRGRWALVDLIRPMAVWRVSPGWFLLAFCWAPSLCLITLFVNHLVTGEPLKKPDGGLLHAPLIMFNILIASFVGEIVWVSYAIGRLSRRISVMLSGVVVGIFWTLWWVPMVIYGHGVIPELPIGALLLNMTGIAAMCAFIYTKTGSGLVVLVLQVMVNSSLLVFPVIPTTGGDSIYWMFAVIYMAAVALLYLMFGPRPIIGLADTTRASLDRTKL